jgi:hypothetical protein
VIPELPEINSGFASCYPKSPNKIWVSGILGSSSGIPGSGFRLRVTGFLPSPRWERERLGKPQGARKEPEEVL